MRRLRRARPGTVTQASAGSAWFGLPRSAYLGFLFLILVAVLIWTQSFRPLVIPSVKAIDSASTIDEQSWFDSAYRDGVRLYVAHVVKWGTCEPWDKAEPQLAMALNAG